MGEGLEELLRRGTRRWNEAGLETYASEFWASDIEYVEDPKWPGSATIRGREDVVRRFAEYEQFLGHADVEAISVIGDEDDAVFLLRIRATGAGSGVPVEHVWAYRVTISDGLFTRLRAYFDPDEAYRDAGLEGR